jgi:hypothetical protein
MIRMLIVGYCCGIRSERRLTQEVELHLAYRWFCKLDLEDEVPHHSTFSANRLGRFRESDVLRHVFERVVWAAMAVGLVKGEGFAVDASVLEANASRYHGKAPEELDWSEKQRQTRAVTEYLAALDEAAEPNPDRKPPKVISPSDPCSAWTAKANKRVQFGYGLNYLIDTENAVRQCQTNANQTAKCAKRIASGCQLTPLGQHGGAVLLEDVASAEVAIVVKVIVDRGVNGGEFLQGLDVPEFRHCPFPSSERLV